MERNRLLRQSWSLVPVSSNERDDQHLDRRPSTSVSIAELYEAAWSQSRRDYDLNRLFNAWYYEI
jgi:hypothetical protein